jgi:hypothetical protein
MEEPIFFTSGKLRIEGKIAAASSTRAAIITHPHPLYGGDMDNPVVTALQRAYSRHGFSTLRFNFRGVGESRGRYDDGTGERQDVAAALALMTDRGMTSIDLAGYSFGSWVNTGLSTGFQRMLMVSPPVAFMSFDPPAPIPTLHLIVTGGRDEIAPAHMISTYKNQWNPKAAFEVLPDADHFYTGFIKTLEDKLSAHI